MFDSIRPQALALLQSAHRRPGATRSQLTRTLNISTGAASDAMAILRQAQLLEESNDPASHGRGRPSARPIPHPAGPLVMALAISHNSWRLHCFEIGNSCLAQRSGRLVTGSAAEVIEQLAVECQQMRKAYGARVRALGVAAPGTVDAHHRLNAWARDWRDIDLTALWHRPDQLATGNDATLAALAETERGVGQANTFALHVYIDAGLGGALIDHGQLVRGARGMAGEFGHLPLGDNAVTCSCGKRGCWGTSVDGTAMARHLELRPPSNPLALGRSILAQAEAGEESSMAAATFAGRSLGRGLGGLVTALDTGVVVCGGMAADLLRVVPQVVRQEFDDHMMSADSERSPELMAAALGDEGPLIGAAESAWQVLWSQFEN